METLYKSILCRLCLYRSEYLIDIFEENGKHGYVAAEVIEDLLQFHVRREDGYPQQVCTKCLDKLTDFKVFKTQCYDSRVTFEKEFSGQTCFAGNHYASSSLTCRSMTAVTEETVTDDYLPPKGIAGRVEVKVEKIDAEEDLYDGGELAEEISAEVDIKTEYACTEEDGAYSQGIAAAGRPEMHSRDGLIHTFDGYRDGYHSAEIGTIRVRNLWMSRLQGGESPLRPGQGPTVGFSRMHTAQGKPSDGGEGGLAGDITTTTPQEEFACPQCGKSFTQLGYMNKHIRVTHNKDMYEKKHECEICKMRFAKRGNLERHAMVHKGVRPFACERCGKAFFHQSDLQAHINSHTRVSPFTCDYCQKGFADKLHLIEHVNRHTGQKPFPCTSCGKQFGSVKNLKLHEKIHEPNPTYRCEECDKTFTNRIYFLGHQRKHSGELFGCLECGKTFVHKYSLKQHEVMHKENGGFTCEVCGKKFDKKNHLRVHTMLHTGEKPFECEYCTKRFHVASHLRVHLKLHTGERSFYCNFCGKGFVQKSHYVDHVRVHTGERPFACTECNRAFCQRQQLKQHMKTHNKARSLKTSITEAVG